LPIQLNFIYNEIRSTTDIYSVQGKKLQPENFTDTGETNPPIAKDKLKAILHAHKLWLDSGGKEGQAADLKGANLKGAVLVSCNLQEANLQEANLYGAYLKNASLKSANLAGANLRGANLRWVNLGQADLGAANLVRADLKDAILTNTNLKGANLKMADGLTQKQIDSALIDESTLLPDIMR
jgi:uncharacterized protein YjbI with pentapeptide repeats